MTIVDSLRQQHPNLILIDGGDWGEASGNFAKSLALYDGMRALNYDVLTLGRRELESALWDSLVADGRSAGVLVGNLRTPKMTNSSNGFAATPCTAVERKGIKVAIISVWLENSPASRGVSEILPAENFLREQLRNTKKADARLVVLYGTGNEAEALSTKFPEVDAWLLAGGMGRVMNATSATNGALIVGPGDRGRELGLLTVEKGKESMQRRASFSPIILGKWVKDSPAAKPFIEKSRPRPNPVQNPNPNNGSLQPAKINRFIGNGSCKLCHEEIFDKWQNTKHAHAIEVLVAKKEDQNEKCLACHTTGFGQVSGFGKAMDGVDLRGIGCEACHGAGEFHVTTERRNNLAATEATCRNCHTIESSPKFVFGEYVKRVH